MRWGIAGKASVGAGIIALSCALLAPSSAQAGIPFDKHGTLKMSVPGSQEPIRSVYEGPFPDMKRSEYVGYVIWQSAKVGPQPEDCNDGPNLDGSLERRKSRQGEWEVFVDQDAPLNFPTHWCPGEWRAAAFVYKKNRDGFYVARLQFAKKKFQVAAGD